MSGVTGMPLPGWAPELKPCGTLAAYRRHLRRGLRGPEIDWACRQANTRSWRDRAAAGQIRPPRVHLDGPGGCYRRDVATTRDPGAVTCRACLSGYGRLPWVRAAARGGGLARAA